MLLLQSFAIGICHVQKNQFNILYVMAASEQAMV